MITLAWIKGESHRWKTFVANRVSEIQDITNKDQWNHVRSEDNPADILSRGIHADQLLQNISHWWQGPSWLSMDRNHWLQEELPLIGELPEEREQRSSFISTIASSDEDPYAMFKKYRHCIDSNG
jgi:hypothetical protein